MNIVRIQAIKKKKTGQASYFITIPIRIMRTKHWQKGTELFVKHDSRHENIIVGLKKHEKEDKA